MHLERSRLSSGGRARDGNSSMQSSSLEKLSIRENDQRLYPMNDEGRDRVRTCHGRIDPANVRQQRNLRKLDSERRRLSHLIPHDFRAFCRVVQSADVEIAKVDLRRRLPWRFVREHPGLVREDVVEEVVLHVLPGERPGSKWSIVQLQSSDHTRRRRD